MHFIQKHILDELRKNESVRYSKLNVDEVESGHFRYHLKELIKDGYVESPDRGTYKLTHLGQSYVDKLSENQIHPNAMPKVITYVLLKAGDRILLHKKTKQPYIDMLNMVSGKIHEGEIAEDAALREVYEKTGVSITTIEPSGVFEVLVSSTDDLLTHAIACAFTAEVDIHLFTSSELYELKTSKLPETQNLAPDFLAIFNAMNNKESVNLQTIKISV